MPDRFVINEAALLRLAIDEMAQGLMMIDADQRIIMVNQQFLDIYGLPGGIIRVGCTARDVVEQSVLRGNYPGMSFERAWGLASQRLAANQPWRVQQRLGNGRVVSIAYALIPGGGWVTTHLDVTERQQAEDRLAYLAGHDALTGLANRTQVIETLERRVAEPGCFALIFVDLDRFKQVNDECGHACGDQLLRQVADRLRRCVRESDTIARFGGDEFIVVQAQIGRPEDASIMAARIVKAIAAPFQLESDRVRIGASVGIAIAPQDGMTADSLLKHADLALYGSKQAGRGTFSHFEHTMLGRKRLQLASS